MAPYNNMTAEDRAERATQIRLANSTTYLLNTTCTRVEATPISIARSLVATLRST